jgi:uncharacterized protein (TIGR03083 family)
VEADEAAAALPVGRGGDDEDRVIEPVGQVVEGGMRGHPTILAGTGPARPSQRMLPRADRLVETRPVDVMALARDERADLADLLADLAPQQWDAPTLCTRWRVRDVVTHMISYEGLGRRELVGRAVRARFRPGRLNDLGVAEHRDEDPAELLARLRARLEPAGMTAGFGGRVALLDGMIHHQDIRRPLGLPRTVPAERLRPALDFARVAPPIRAFWRIRGLRLVATDLGWTTGRGPEVRGPGEALLMAMAGRRGVVHELAGPGRDTLAARIG